VETENVGMDEVWQGLDVVEIFLMGWHFRNFELLIRSKEVGLIIENSVVEVVIE
jgi:hypothetical protein